MAEVLAVEVKALAEKFGLERLGFLTLTFADPVKDIREASRRFNSLNTHVLKARYSRAIVVTERQASGRIHYHLLVVLNADIRSGCDFEALGKCDYRSANAALRAEWAFWRQTAPKYRFGRTELLPVKSNEEGIARYVGKYISKHVNQREEADKGARLVRFIGYKPGQRRASVRFAWNTDNGWLWRHKLGAYAKNVGAKSTDDLYRVFGPRWAYLLQDEIMGTPVGSGTIYPSYWAVTEASKRQDPMHIARAQADAIMDENGAKNVRVSMDTRAKYQAGPVWSVPAWADNLPVFVPPPQEAVDAYLKRAREMRLYIMRLEHPTPVPLEGTLPKKFGQGVVPSRRHCERLEPQLTLDWSEACKGGMESSS